MNHTWLSMLMISFSLKGSPLLLKNTSLIFCTIQRWCDQNDLQLNPEKTVQMFIQKKNAFSSPENHENIEIRDSKILRCRTQHNIRLHGKSAIRVHQGVSKTLHHSYSKAFRINRRTVRRHLGVGLLGADTWAATFGRTTFEREDK